MFLVDTNIWLEILLGQEKAEEANNFFRIVEASELNITDFSLYSIGIILSRLQKYDIWAAFLADTLEDSTVRVIRPDNQDLKKISVIQRTFNLDFDDAYQYTLAEKHNLTIISFDGDFDKTPKGKKTPTQI